MLFDVTNIKAKSKKQTSNDVKKAFNLEVDRLQQENEECVIQQELIILNESNVKIQLL